MQSGMRRSERGDPSAGCVPGDGETLGRDAVRYMDVMPEGTWAVPAALGGRNGAPPQGPLMGFSPVSHAALTGAR